MRVDGVGGVAALVALVAPGPRQRLLHRVAGEHAEGAGDAGVELDVLDAARGLGADEVVVVGLAADHGAEAGDPGDVAGADQASRRAAARRRPGTRTWSTFRTLTPASSKPSSAPLQQPVRRGPRRSARRRPRTAAEPVARSSSLNCSRSPLSVTPSLGVALLLGVDHLLVERQALVVERVADACRASSAGSPRCGCWDRTRSAPAR